MHLSVSLNCLKKVQAGTAENCLVAEYEGIHGMVTLVKKQKLESWRRLPRDKRRTWSSTILSVRCDWWASSHDMLIVSGGHSVDEAVWLCAIKLCLWLSDTSLTAAMLCLCDAGEPSLQGWEYSLKGWKAKSSGNNLDSVVFCMTLCACSAFTIGTESACLTKCGKGVEASVFTR
jgi:hypothetical protein